MAQVFVDGYDLVIEQSTAEKVFSLRSTLRFPLSAVSGITRDSTMGHEGRGLRAPGTDVPRFFTAGTFYRHGRKTFWNIRDGSRAVVITLHDSDFDQLVIDVDEPLQTVAAVTAALSALPSATALDNDAEGRHSA